MQHSSSRPALVVALVLVLAVALTGCGEGKNKAKAAPTGPSPEVTSCRAQWSDLAGRYDGRSDSTLDSDLGSRWNTVLATLDYYVTSASAKDCQTLLDNQQSAINDLEAFSTMLRRWDMNYQDLDAVNAVDRYLRSPLPKLKPLKKGKPAPKPASKKLLRRAVTLLRSNAPGASTDMAAGWEEANQVDLDPAAEAKAVKDLAFLASQSTRYQICLVALKVIRQAESATAQNSTP
jgi:hypothetical protein